MAETESPVGRAAARAAAERERRRRRPTPLLEAAVPEGEGLAARDPAAGGGAGHALADVLHAASEVGERLADDLAAEGLLPGDAGHGSVAGGGAAPGGPGGVRPGGTRRAAAAPTAVPGDDLAGRAQRLLVEAVDHLRRRVSGDYEVDEFGFDPELTERVLFALLRPVYHRWFRVELRGTAHVPRDTGALLVGNHSGTLAWDALMTQVAVHEGTGGADGGRFLRPLGADLVFATPVMGDIARRMGATLASTTDAERLLSRGELVGVWPEGFKGIGKPFRDRYRLQRFGRGGFVAAAIRAGVPIVPVSIVGAEEIYPMIADVRPLARLLGTPYWPVTPLWPWFGLLGLVPLPSKWLIEFGVPVPTDELDRTAADDPMVVFEVTDEVREVIQQTLYALLVQRRSAFL